eukprot:scaffold5355_cov51-Attheya_sp.AAC.3
MMRQSLDLLLLSLAASVALSSMGVVLGFGMHQSHNSRHNKHYIVSRTVSSSVLFQETATWSEYKQDYVDPQVLADHVAHFQTDRSMEDASYQAKQAHANADAYWAWQFEQDHEKLQQLNKDHVKRRSDAESLSLTDTWSHYKHDYIDTLPKQHVKHSHIDNDDDDDNDSRGDSKYSSLTDTWSHYKHDYIDKLPKPDSLSP